MAQRRGPLCHESDNTDEPDELAKANLFTIQQNPNADCSGDPHRLATGSLFLLRRYDINPGRDIQKVNDAVEVTVRFQLKRAGG